MMFILPHSAEVRHGKIPWVVTTIAMLCLFICYLQEARRESINNVIKPYCERIHDHTSEDGNDFLRQSHYRCELHLTYLHDLPDKSKYKKILKHWWETLPQAEEGSDKGSDDDVITSDELETMTQHAYRHYESIKGELPPSLDRKLVYDPGTPNPIRAITSALAHADWWHVIGNLIFFFAFAPALEYIIASAFRFTLSLLGITFSVAIADSLATLLGSPGNITLGLSGVVSGTIGMAAFLMPNVRIRTFIWFLHFARNIQVPVWILAVWYIGWDMYDLTTSEWLSGVNFLAHVAGGVSGYFIAMVFFKTRKDETAEEVADEVAYMTSRRQDKLGIMSSYRSTDNHLSNALREERARKDYERHIDDVHRAVTTGQDSLAIILLLEDYEGYQGSIEVYEGIYQEMIKWKHTRAILCLSRLLISEYIKQRKYARAVEITNTAYDITPQFVFADVEEHRLLAAMSEKYQLGLPS